MITYLPPTPAEIAQHRQEIERRSWLRQVWHRVMTDCLLCQWHQARLKRAWDDSRVAMKDARDAEQPGRDQPPNSRS